MSKITELNRVKSLLTQALSVASNTMPYNESLRDMKNHIKKAINEIDSAVQHVSTKKELSQKTHQEMWQETLAKTAKSVSAKTAHSASGFHAGENAIKYLDEMISREQSKIDELEKSSLQLDPITQLLNS